MHSKTVDPYYEWLGIPPKDQPPNHYRLLGLELFEENRSVIDAAANRRNRTMARDWAAIKNWA